MVKGFSLTTHQMDEDHVDHDQVSDHEEYQKKMKRSTPSGSSCEVDHAETDDGVSVIKDDIDTAPSATTLLHECNICGKTFTNGKALGGHRRSHFQAAKKKLQVKTRFSNNHSKVLVEDHSNANNNRASCDVDGKNGEPICYLCKKKFPTKNALYGHMRAHPDRICRGICPPNNHHHSHHEHINNSSDSSLEQNINNKEDQGVVVVAPNAAIDLSNSTLLPSWQKKDKRGRKCIGSYEAATNLLYLCAEYISAAESINYKKGGGGGGGGSVNVEPPKSTTSPHEVVVPMQSKSYKRKKIGECESSSTGEENAPAHKIKCIFISGSLMKFGSDGGSGGDCDNDNRKSSGMKGLSESGVEKIAVNIMDVEGHCGKKVVKNERSSDIDDDDKRKVKKVKKGKKIIIKDSSTDAEKLLGGYECGICGKSFSTFQGLGGHKSVHKEKNIVTSDAIMDDESKHSDATVTDEGNKYSPISNIDHVPKVDQDTPPLSEDEEASQSTTEPKNLDFDLNEPYVMLD